LVILLAGLAADSASGVAQVKVQPESNSKLKCGQNLGFAVYEKWEKPVGLFPFYQDCKLGYVDARGRVVIPAQFDWGDSFYDQLAVVGVTTNEKTKYGFINLAGRFVIDPEFDSAQHFSDGLAGVRLGNQSGYVNRKGVVVIPPRFAEVTPFFRGLARVKISNDKTHRGKWGCINKKGEFVVPPQYDEIRHFTDQIVVSGLFNGDRWKWGLISWTGETIFEPHFDLIGSFYGGVAAITHGGKRGLINSEGQLIGNQTYHQALTNFSEGLMAVMVDRQVGYLNRRGEWAIPPKFNYAGAFSEGLAPVKIGDKFGYIDKVGRVVIKPQFEEAIAFSEGLAVVRIGAHYGFIDRKGLVKIQPRFQGVSSFRSGVAFAPFYGDEGYINRNGEFIRRWRASDRDYLYKPPAIVTPLDKL
jgi:serine/threonine-protein kinase